MEGILKRDNNANVYALIIFLIGLFLSIGLTAPGLQVNDEWITVNQLHQLIQGHQVLTNEGKYGTVFGNMVGYFEHRHNILGYSLFLPIISIIPLLYIIISGDSFRLWVILLWAFIPIIATLIIQLDLPQYGKIKKIPLFIPGFLCSSILLFLNLNWYSPFSSIFQTAPIEAAAVVLMENVLFAIFCSLLFYIGRFIYSNTRQAIWFVIAMICCSSYLFWATNAKDHLLTIFLICCVIICFINYYKAGTRIFGGLGFLFCGLLLWARPEIGFTVMIAVTIQYLYMQISQNQEKISLRKICCILFLPLFFLGGALPFFVNNHLLTNNFLYPPYLEYETTLTSKTPQDITNINPNSTLSSEYLNKYSNQNGSLDYIHLISKYFTPTSSDLLKDLWRISLFPPNGSVGLFIVSPFIIIGVLSLLYLLLINTNFSKNDAQTIILCSLISLAVFFAYIRNLSGQPLSVGIGPDMRYYSPLYLPMGIIALISMKYYKQNLITPNLWVKTIVVLFVGTPMVIISLLLLQPWGGGSVSFNYVFSLMNLGLICLFFVQLFFMRFNRWHHQFLQMNLIGMLLISFAWQIMLVFLYSFAKFDGYSFWIPITEQLFNQFIIPVS